MSNKFGEQYYDLTLNALRVVAGLLFMTHGGQKLFGWFGAESSFTAFWPFGVAGVLEFFGGLAIALGLFPRYVAFVVAGEMAVTFFWRSRRSTASSGSSSGRRAAGAGRSRRGSGVGCRRRGADASGERGHTDR